MNPNDPHIPRRRDVDPHLPPWWEWILDHLSSNWVRFMVTVGGSAAVVAVVVAVTR